MSPLQKLQVKQSEIREKINTLLGNDKRSEEQDAELVLSSPPKARRSSPKFERP